jgi:hypothetical protein
LPALLERIWIRWVNGAQWLASIVSRRKQKQVEGMSPAKESRIGIVLSFVIHQFIGTWVVGFTVPWIVIFGFAILRLFGKTFYMRDMYWISTETGYFPLQIAFALFLGWLLGRDLRRRSMLWIWVIPFVFLCYVVAAVPTIVPFAVPPTLQSGIGQSRLWHYLGPGCRPERRCLDQIIITMPFYAAAAYSIGALLAPSAPRDSRLAVAIRFWTSLTVGLLFLAGATALIIEAMRPQAQSLIQQYAGFGFLSWTMLALGLVPLVMGACLIFFADWLRRKQQVLAEGNIA